ncbi:MAG: hypothetical protein ACM4AI_27020 [Acidobacteriota bacterium]
MRIYTLTLRAFPARHRADYAAEMIDAFDQEVRTQCRDRGAWRARRFVLAAWLNAVAVTRPSAANFKLRTSNLDRTEIDFELRL